MRVYVPIIVRGQETEGVKFWGFGKMIYEELLAFIADPDYGDISDPQSGRDIVVTVKSAEEVGKSYAETTIRVKPKETQVTDNSSVIEKIKQQQNITELFPEPTYDELKSQLQTWLGTSSQEESSKEVNYKETVSTKQTPTIDEIDNAFKDLF